METKKHIKVGIAMVACLLMGAFMRDVMPVNNNSINDNSARIYISSIFSDDKENVDKININDANLQQFKDLRIGIGAKKYADIVENRPFERVSDLRRKKVLGYITYNKIKGIATVGE